MYSLVNYGPFRLSRVHSFFFKDFELYQITIKLETDISEFNIPAYAAHNEQRLVLRPTNQIGPGSSPEQGSRITADPAVPSSHLGLFDEWKPGLSFGVYMYSMTMFECSPGIYM